MWICQVDTDDYDYPDTYGPFDTEIQAIMFEPAYRAAYPEMDGDESLTFRPVRVLNPSDLPGSNDRNIPTKGSP